MAIIRPFYAFRPKADLVEKIASPPYDVVTTDQARELARDNPYSFLHVVRPEIDLPPDTDPYSSAVYQKAAENLQGMIKNGYLIKDTKPSLFAYSQQRGAHVQTGIVACCSADEYDADVIKKHEKTRADKEEDRTRHIVATSAHTGPVFLMYRDVKMINDLVGKTCKENPLYHFTAPDGVIHTVHQISDSGSLKILIEQFAALENLYIADGHHRSAASSRARAEKRSANPNHKGDEEYNYFLAVLFPASSLKIMPYNRVVKDVRGLSVEELFRQIEKHFQIQEVKTPQADSKGRFCMYFKGKWRLLIDKPGEHPTDDPVMKLDANILQRYLLDPVLGIKDPRTDKRISFVGGIHGTKELERQVDEGKGEVAFLLHPAHTEDIMEVSDAGKVMPPKSTWFEPKLRSGLMVHIF
ncbi:DUF1015 domain-containing protein [Candidatus Sumerlaeota bacterium]|nr:DUF1015 domain-containing protein [Candidatus Sumerlaeota bacterium]